jgi:hypothetical protein
MVLQIVPVMNIFSSLVPPHAFGCAHIHAPLPISSKPPQDLYVSLNNQFPNITTARWMSRSYSSDSVTIASTDSRINCGSCPVFITVFGYTAATYSIVRILVTFSHPFTWKLPRKFSRLCFLTLSNLYPS